MGRECVREGGRDGKNEKRRGGGCKSAVGGSESQKGREGKITRERE